MSRHSQRTPGSRRPLVLLILFLAVVVGGIWALRAYQGRVEAQPPPTSDRRGVARVYFACTQHGQPRMTAVTRRVPAGQRAAAAALREITTGEVPRGCSRPLPAGTRVLGVRVSSGMAIVDFSAEFVSRFVGGADNEGVVVYSVVNTLTSLRGIDRVRILVEGKPIESIGGHLDVSGPLHADDELVIPAPNVDGRPAG